MDTVSSVSVVTMNKQDTISVIEGRIAEVNKAIDELKRSHYESETPVKFVDTAVDFYARIIERNTYNACLELVKNIGRK